MSFNINLFLKVTGVPDGEMSRSRLQERLFECEMVSEPLHTPRSILEDFLSDGPLPRCPRFRGSSYIRIVQTFYPSSVDTDLSLLVSLPLLSVPVLSSLTLFLLSLLKYLTFLKPKVITLVKLQQLVSSLPYIELFNFPREPECTPSI